MLRADVSTISAHLIKSYFSRESERSQLDALVLRLTGALLGASTPTEALDLARACCRANKRRPRKLAEALGSLGLSGEPFSYGSVRLAALLSVDVEFGAAVAGYAAAMVATLPQLEFTSPMIFAVLDLLCALTASGSPATMAVVSTRHSARSLVRLGLRVERVAADKTTTSDVAEHGPPRRPPSYAELSENNRNHLWDRCFSRSYRQVLPFPPHRTRV